MEGGWWGEDHLRVSATAICELSQEGKAMFLSEGRGRKQGDEGMKEQEILLFIREGEYLQNKHAGNTFAGPTCSFTSRKHVRVAALTGHGCRLFAWWGMSDRYFCCAAGEACIQINIAGQMLFFSFRVLALMEIPLNRVLEEVRVDYKGF